MRLRHKDWAEELLASHRDRALEKSDIEEGKLPNYASLEIGSGCGEFLIQKAKLNPDRIYLGIEINRTAFAIAVKKLFLEEQVPANLYFVNASIDTLLPLIKNESLDEVYLNFNDPWPKKRHNRRRLTYPTRLEEYYRVLKPKGLLLYKSDNDIYYEASKEYFTEFKKFKYEFFDNYETVAEGDVMSEYEQKFRKVGKPIHRIIAVKE